MKKLTIVMGTENALVESVMMKLFDAAPAHSMVESWPEVDRGAPIHPSRQGAFTDYLIGFAEHRDVFICTHSDALVLRVRRRVAEGKIKPENVQLVWVEPDGTHKPITLNDRGTPSWMPREAGSRPQADEFAALRRVLQARDEKDLVKAELPTGPEGP